MQLMIDKGHGQLSAVVISRATMTRTPPPTTGWSSRRSAERQRFVRNLPRGIQEAGSPMLAIQPRFIVDLKDTSRIETLPPKAQLPSASMTDREGSLRTRILMQGAKVRPIVFLLGTRVIGSGMTPEESGTKVPEALQNPGGTRTTLCVMQCRERAFHLTALDHSARPCQARADQPAGSRERVGSLAANWSGAGNPCQ